MRSHHRSPQTLIHFNLFAQSKRWAFSTSWVDRPNSSNRKRKRLLRSMPTPRRRSTTNARTVTHSSRPSTTSVRSAGLKKSPHDQLLTDVLSADTRKETDDQPRNCIDHSRV